VGVGVDEARQYAASFGLEDLICGGEAAVMLGFVTHKDDATPLATNDRRRENLERREFGASPCLGTDRGDDLVRSPNEEAHLLSEPSWVGL
jgi:hypothetical protein